MTIDQPSNRASKAWRRLLAELRSCVLLESPQQSTDSATTGNLAVRDAAGISLDISRTPLNNRALQHLTHCAATLQLRQSIEALFAGEAINSTENRPALHTALRDIFASGNDQNQLARSTVDQVIDIATKIRAGNWRQGAAITDVVNIGIGGSDLGPRMVSTALGANGAGARQHEHCSVHYVANIDPAELEQVLSRCQPETTLFIIASKSFTTLETLENAKAAKQWLLAAGLSEPALRDYLIAVTANVQAAIEFGIDEKCILPIWDSVGGRYSLWSAIGLSIAIDIGPDRFTDLLSGAQRMDQHFLHEDFEHNLPFILASLEIIYVNVLGAQSVAVLPYSHRLRLLPAYLQQLCMESNGKRTTNSHKTADYNTCPVIWGSAGTVGQHSFHQLLHQGTHLIPIDLILPLNAAIDDLDAKDRHAQLVANCLAQSKALFEGSEQTTERDALICQGFSEEQANALAVHKASPGKRPNTIIGMDELNATTLGALLAMYEHKVFVQSVFWQINAFDQWGVELGKQLSAPIYKALTGNASSSTDKTTQYWIDRFKNANTNQ